MAGRYVSYYLPRPLRYAVQALAWESRDLTNPQLVMSRGMRSLLIAGARSLKLISPDNTEYCGPVYTCAACGEQCGAPMCPTCESRKVKD
jgi:hypothetical protein